MFRVSREKFKELRKAGLIQSGKTNKNYKVINKDKKSKRKKYLVAEEFKILKFLGIEGETYDQEEFI